MPLISFKGWKIWNILQSLFFKYFISLHTFIRNVFTEDLCKFNWGYLKKRCNSTLLSLHSSRKWGHKKIVITFNHMLRSIFSSTIVNHSQENYNEQSLWIILYKSGWITVISYTYIIFIANSNNTSAVNNEI